MQHKKMSEFDVDSLEFSKPYSDQGKMKVDIKSKDSNRKGMQFQLCSDFQEPYRARYPLDKVQDEPGNQGNPERRGQAICIDDDKVLSVLQKLDEKIVDFACEHSQELFKSKNPLHRDIVMSKYQPIVTSNNKRDESDAEYYMKFKVKVETAKVLTKLHLYDPSTREVRPNKASVEHLEQRDCKLAPRLSAFGLWFMGGGSKFGLALQAEELIVTPGKDMDPIAAFATNTSYNTVSDDHDSRKRSSEEVKLEGDEMHSPKAMKSDEDSAM